MFSKGKSICVKWLQGMAECLVLFPVILLIGIFFIPSHLIWIWIGSLPVLFMLGLLFRTLLMNHKRWVYLFLTLLTGSLMPLIAMNDGLLSIVISWIIGFSVTYRAILYAQHSWEDVFSVSILWVGLPIYFVAYFFYRYNGTLYPYLDAMTWAGMVTLVLTLFLTNSAILKTATLSNEKRPFLSRTLKWHNRFFILTTIIIILLLTNYKLLQDAFSNLTAMISNWIKWFFSLFGNDEPVEATAPELPEQPSFGEQGEASAFAEMIERIVIIVAIVVGIVACLVLLYYLSKKMRRWLKKGFAWVLAFLNQMLQRTDQDDEDRQYIDEKESLMDWKQWRKNYEDKVKDWLSSMFKREPRWEDLPNNRERVRYLYRHFIMQQMKNGYQLKRYHTPSEAIDDIQKRNSTNESNVNELEKKYSKARYGNQEISDQNIKDINSNIDR
jgi:hypothetical protein